MEELIRAVVVHDGLIDPDVVHALLSEEGEVEIVARATGLESSWDVVAETHCDVIVVACLGYSDSVTDFLERAGDECPGRPVVVVCEGTANGFVNEAFAAGAEDILTLPDGTDAALARGFAPQLMFTLRKAVTRRNGAVSTAPSQGRMICVVGPKGGVGKTLTAVNLGVCLADAGHKVAVVDLDLQFGDVGLVMGLAPERTLYDLVKSGGTIDAEKLQAFMTPHGSGAEVLLAPIRPDHASIIEIPLLREVFSLLRAMYDFVVVDTQPGFTPEVIAAIDSSSHLCMIGMLDSLSLKSTKLGLETLELMGYDRERVKLVLNRSDSRVGITTDDVVAIVGKVPDVLVPSDREITRSINEGTPIAVANRRSEAAKSFHYLAALYSPSRERAARPRRRLAAVLPGVER
jgi:pilus assembly protein CpaE